MAYTTINKSSLHMNPKAYMGNQSTLNVTGVGFQPDLVWLKKRGNTSDHYLTDAVRGVTKTVYANLTNGESTVAAGLTAFGADGFSIGADTGINQDTQTQMSWSWKAGGGAGSSNTDGTINTTSTSVNTTNGFSISTFTGNSTSGATVGHGLGAVPACVWIKRTDNNDGLVVYHKSMGNTKHLKTDRDNAEATGTAYWNDTSPTSSVVTLGNDTGVNTGTYVMYAWAEKTGYSKFGGFTGNGNANGAFVYTGFKPSLVICKRRNGAAHWVINDKERSGTGVGGYNPAVRLYPNLNNAEESTGEVDLLSNGFKARTTNDNQNGNNDTYIYMAFGQSIVGSNNIPCTARQENK